MENHSAEAVHHFKSKLRFETDPSDVARDRARGRGPILIDVRDQASWDQGRIPEAFHVPLSELPARIGQGPLEDINASLVVYCWGPGCNGSTRAALILSERGFTNVKEMIGGFEYWAREGLAISDTRGRRRLTPDPLTVPTEAIIRDLP
ncbi:MAG: rhodanese-like domain-containing protein [Actinomycetota bacterium]|nr:rhodanese-like domain-containing protein [Actinomycetota bacterium]